MGKRGPWNQAPKDTKELATCICHHFMLPSDLSAHMMLPAPHCEPSCQVSCLTHAHIPVLSLGWCLEDAPSLWASLAPTAHVSVWRLISLPLPSFCWDLDVWASEIHWNELVPGWPEPVVSFVQFRYRKQIGLRRLAACSNSKASYQWQQGSRVSTYCAPVTPRTQVIESLQ